MTSHVNEPGSETTPAVQEAAERPSSQSPHSVRLITVAYNPGKEIERLFASVAAATTRPATLVIADNGSDHALVEEVAARYGALVVSDGTNRGYGGGINLGAAGMKEDFILIANPDVVFTPGSLDVLIDAALADASAGCLGPRILSSDGSIYPSGRALPSLVRGTGHALLARIWPSNPFSAAYHDQHDLGEIREVGWLSGACLLLPRRVWEQLGGFDERYFMFFEDVDLGARVSAHGLRNLQVPQAVVTHEQGSSWKARPENMIRAHHASARLYLSRAYSRPWQAPLRLGVCAGLRLREELQVRRSRR